MTNLTDPIFQNEDKARAYLEAQRWPDGPYCPFCGQYETVKALGGKSMGPGWYHCKECRKKFTVRVGTLYERSKIPLHKWLLATHLMCASKKGISAHQLHRMLGITYKSAWFMAHRVREGMRDNEPVDGPLGGEGQNVEVDETFIGNKKSRPKTDPDQYVSGYGWVAGAKSSGTSHKHAIMTLVERGGRARSFHVSGVNSKTLRPIIMRNADRTSRLQTDEASFYVKLGQEFKGGHGQVKHAIGQYKKGDDYTQTVEGFFSIFKRGMKGIYQHCSEQHLQRYLHEFDFRYSNRGISDWERTAEALKGIEGKRLTYRRPDEARND